MKACMMLIFGILLFGCITTTETGWEKTSPGEETASDEDCAEMECFIEKSENCDSAKFRFNQTVDVFGAVTVSVSDLELKKAENLSECILNIKNVNMTTHYGESLKDTLKDGGMSDEQISDAEKKINEENKKLAGKEGTCIYAIEDLTEILNNWKEGKVSTSDYDKAECSGDLFKETGSEMEWTKDENETEEDSDAATAPVDEIENASTWGYEYTDDPYSGPDELTCIFSEGTDLPATPDKITYSFGRKKKQIEIFGRYFVTNKISHCSRETTVYKVSCEAENGIAKSFLANCSEGTTCVNGRCVNSSKAAGQKTCSDIFGDGGEVVLCEGYSYRHSSGIRIRPTITEDGSGGFTASLEVDNNGNVTSYEPKVSGKEATRYFTTHDKANTISIRVLSYGTEYTPYDTYGKEVYTMNLQIEQRYGLDPALLEE